MVCAASRWRFASLIHFQPSAGRVQRLRLDHLLPGRPTPSYELDAWSTLHCPFKRPVSAGPFVPRSNDHVDRTADVGFNAGYQVVELPEIGITDNHEIDVLGCHLIGVGPRPEDECVLNAIDRRECVTQPRFWPHRLGQKAAKLPVDRRRPIRLDQTGSARGLGNDQTGSFEPFHLLMDAADRSAGASSQFTERQRFQGEYE